MSSLADLPELVGFFSYSREDDEDSHGALSALRERIQRELRGQLGRSMKTFRLWQDKEAIAAGTLWEAEIKTAAAQAVFFIPIITPTVVRSPYCRFELEAFLEREAALGRSDLVFPILYIRVAELEAGDRRQNDPVISIIAQRQYLDWREYRHRDVHSTDVKEAIERFCAQICDALHRSWLPPEERKKLDETAAARLAEAERQQQDAENRRREETTRAKTEKEARDRADEERRRREAEKQRRQEEDERRRRAANAARASGDGAVQPLGPQSRQSSRNALIGAGVIGAVVLGAVAVWLNAAPPTPAAPPSPAATAASPTVVATAPSAVAPPPASVAPAPAYVAPAPTAPSPYVVAPVGGTIKVGILHSLSGTMAISETTLKDEMLMLIDEQNKKGGVLGRKLEAVVVDPASNWPLFAEKARELISVDHVAVVFGCWTSVSRKSVLPVFKELDNLLFYPVQFEGEESERNVIYTGAAPNQQAIPAVDYLMSPDGGSVKRWVLEGTDYVYPRTTNKILESYLKLKGVRDEDIMINYTPFGFSDWQTEVSKIKAFGSTGKKTAVVSTINGDANVPFYKELGNQGIKATDIPVMALSVGEDELAGLDTKPLVGHLAAWNYFESINTPANAAFIRKWHDFTKNPLGITNDPMEAQYIGFNMWVAAVQKAGTADPDQVIEALPGTQTPNLTGGIATLLPNHYITKPFFVGEIRSDGQFNPIWKSRDLIPGAAWSPYLPGSKDLVADWVKLKCGNWNSATRACGGS